MALMLRGDFDAMGVDEQFRAIKGFGGKNRDRNEGWMDWCNNNWMLGYCKVPPVGCKRSATSVTNRLGVRGMFRGLQEKFGQMYRRQAFVHVFTEQGMD